MLNAYDGKNQVITNYDLEPNTQSDQKFSEDIIKVLSQNSTPDNNTEAEKINLNIDGAYYTDELAKEAVLHNINLIPGELTGSQT